MNCFFISYSYYYDKIIIFAFKFKVKTIMKKTLLIIGLLFVSIAVSAKEWKDLSNKEKEEFANHLNHKELQIEPNNEDVINLSEDKIPVASSVSDDMSFAEAFITAREEVGPGGVFEWNGKIYNTYYTEEWDNLSNEEKKEFENYMIIKEIQYEELQTKPNKEEKIETELVNDEKLQAEPNKEEKIETEPVKNKETQIEPNKEEIINVEPKNEKVEATEEIINSKDKSSSQTDNQTPSYIKDKVSVSLGLGYKGKLGLYESNRIIINAEGLYGINNWLEGGIYVSYLTEKTMIGKIEELSLQRMSTRINVLDYGVKGRAHILPLIIKPSFNMIDVYANVEVGAHTVIFSKDIPNSNYTKFAFNVGGGVGYNFSKSIGIFYECNYSNIYKLNHKYGVMFRF